MKQKNKFSLRSIFILLGACTVLALCAYAFTLMRTHFMQKQLRALYVPFDQSMAAQQFQPVLDAEFSKAVYAICKRVYENNNFSCLTCSTRPKIPKIIHHIWLGSPFPQEFKPYLESWHQHHPGWRFMFWTDETIKNIKLFNQDLFDASMNYGERADILRYELLYRYGGLYVDVDFECLKPLDALHHGYDFFIGMQPLDTGCAQLGIGLIGAAPGHPLVKTFIEKIRENKTSQIIARTGPVHATIVLCRYVQEHGQGIGVLPATYFYPCSYAQKGTPPTIWRRPESYAVHHWAGSWLRPTGFVNEATR